MTENLIRLVDWFPQCSVGAPELKIYYSGSDTVMTYMTDEDSIIEVKFINTIACKIEAINNEVQFNYPIYTKIENCFSNGIIENSSWFKEIKDIHKVHPYFNVSSWHNYIHYYFALKENIFQIIAREYIIKK